MAVPSYPISLQSARTGSPRLRLNIEQLLFLIRRALVSFAHTDEKGYSAKSCEILRSFCYLFRKGPVGLHLQSPLSFFLLFTLFNLHSLLKPRRLISNLLRTFSPLGDCGLTRHNIRAGWPEKDPKESRDRGRETVEQRMIMNGPSAGGSHKGIELVSWDEHSSRDFCWCFSAFSSWKHFPGWGGIWGCFKEVWAFCVLNNMRSTRTDCMLTSWNKKWDWSSQSPCWQNIHHIFWSLGALFAWGGKVSVAPVSYSHGKHGRCFIRNKIIAFI